MRKLSLLLPCLLVAAVAVGCGGGSKKSVTIGDTKYSTSDKVPDSFPKDFPVYKGAKVVGSISTTTQGVKGTLVTWETGDSLDKVKDFYNQEFKDGPWKSDSNGDLGGSAFWSGESKDGKQALYVIATRDGDKTTIGATVGPKDQASSDSSSDGGDSGSAETSTSSTTKKTPPPSSDASDESSSSPAAAELPDEVKLSDDFPKDRVPLPSGGRVTNTSSFSSGGTKTFFVEVYVKDKAANVADYFKEELPKHSWTNAFTSESNGEFFLTYSGEGGDGTEAVTINVAESDTPGYAKASISVVIAE